MSAIMFNPKVQRSNDIKDVIHIKVKKYAGYFNPESRSFAVDPHLTTFEDLQKILVEAFNLNGPFHITYLCRDDAGESVFLSMLTDWDLDAAFMTSSEPHLRLKLDAEPYKDGLMSKMKDWDSSDSPGNIFPNNSNLVKNILQPVASSMNMLSFHNVQKHWIDSLGGAFNKLSSGLGYSINQQEEHAFFPSKTPLDDAEFRTFLGEDGRLTKPEELRLRVYHGGVTPALRKVVWRMLLNIFPDHLTGRERIAYIKRKTDEYERLRLKWQAKVDTESVKQISNMVWKDVLRTDRSTEFYKGYDDNPNTIALMNILTTFALTHPKVSYCQGMSDLVSPIFMVMNNEAQAYICFCGIMTRLQDNFSSDGRAVSIKFKHLGMLVKHYDSEFFNYLQSLGADNMFFCYRWILLEMKREFSFDDAITVLEVMWSSLPPQPPDEDLPLEDYAQSHNSSETTSPHQFNQCQNITEKNVRREEKKAKKSPSKMKESTTKRRNSDDLSVNLKFDSKSTSQKRPLLKEALSSSSSNSFSSFDSLSDCEVMLSALRSDAAESTITNNDADKCKTDKKCDGDVEGDTDDDTVSYGSSTIDGNVGFHSPGLRKRTFNSSKDNEERSDPTDGDSISRLPPPEEFGCGNPFLLFVCLAVLLDERGSLMSAHMEYDDLVMHFDKMVRKHSPKKVLSKAMKLFAEYLRSDLAATSTT